MNDELVHKIFGLLLCVIFLGTAIMMFRLTFPPDDDSLDANGNLILVSPHSGARWSCENCEKSSAMLSTKHGFALWKSHRDILTSAKKHSKETGHTVVYEKTHVYNKKS